MKETEEPGGAKVKSSKVKAKKKKVRPDAESSQREETEVRGGEESLCNIRLKLHVVRTLKTMLSTVVSLLVCIMVASLVCTVVKDPASCRVEKSECGCEHINWKEVHSVPVLRGEVGGVHFGKVHSRFPWTRGKGEDDVMMFTNHSTHAPGVKLTVPTSTRRTSNVVDAVSDWQQDAEARMGPAGLGEDGNKEDFSGTWKAGLEKKYTHNGLEAEVHVEVEVHPARVDSGTKTTDRYCLL